MKKLMSMHPLWWFGTGGLIAYATALFCTNWEWNGWVRIMFFVWFVLMFSGGILSNKILKKQKD